MTVKGKAHLVGTDIFIELPVASINNTIININCPKQMCFICGDLFEAWMVDDVIWERLPEKYQDKFICSHCFGMKIKKRRDD